MQRPDPNHRLSTLDGLRGVAAIGVLLYHTQGLALSYHLFARFYLFVDLFFILSGFVLTLVVEPQLRAGGTVEQFIRARIKRLWPLIALGVLLGALAFSTKAPIADVARLALLGLLMVPILYGHTMMYPLNGPQWSLAWELVANLLHGLVLRRLGNRGLLTLLAIFAVLELLTIHHTGDGLSGPNVVNWWAAAPRVCWSYTLGIWMARRWLVDKPIAVLDGRIAMLLPALAIALLAQLPLSLAVGDAAAVLVVLPALFWLAATAKPPATASAWPGRLGAMSYPLYATHAAVLTFWNIDAAADLTYQALAFASAVAFAAGVAWLSSLRSPTNFAHRWKKSAVA